MNVHEYQAKDVLREFGVAVPEGRLAATPADAEEAARALGGDVVVVKAQVHAGGRGKGKFKEAEAACLAIIEAGRKDGKSYPLPAYDKCIEASHLFNLLDARGVISATERQSYILRVRTLAKACCEAWLESPQGRTEGAGVVDYAEV